MTGYRETDRGQDSSLEDMLIPAIPATISSLVVQGFADVHGVVKIGVGALLGVVLWWLLARRRGETFRVPKLSRRRWALVLAAMTAIAVLVLGVTVLALRRPTPSTAVVTLLAIAILNGAALTGRRLPGAAAAAVTGGLIGLCLGLALLRPL